MVTSAGRAKVVDLRRERERRLAGQLAPTLERSHAMVPTATLTSVEEWRTAARMAGRANGWRVRTGLTQDGEHVWAMRNDIEPDEEDLRAAADRLDDLLFGPGSPGAATPARRRGKGLRLLPLP